MTNPFPGALEVDSHYNDERMYFFTPQSLYIVIMEKIKHLFLLHLCLILVLFCAVLSQ